jgi:hypothetical protein
MSISYDTAESIVHGLKEIGILSDTLTLIEENLNDKSRMNADIIRTHNISSERSGELLKLLKASSIKYTAGRYFRAGMVFSIVAVIDKMYSKLDRPSALQSSLEKQYAFSEGQ